MQGAVERQNGVDCRCATSGRDVPPWKNVARLGDEYVGIVVRDGVVRGERKNCDRDHWLSLWLHRCW
eukprot:4243042-Prymnesium_polylepis.1